VQMFEREVRPLDESADTDACSWQGLVPAAARTTPGDHASSLLRTIEAEIIPRLMLAHKTPSNDAQAPPEAPPSVGPQQVEELTRIILSGDTALAQDYVRARCRAGLSLEVLFLGLLGPVAQRLGTMWDADLCDFTQVTVGLWRLQQIVYEYGPAFQRERPDSPPQGPVRRILLVPLPGTQHTFGIVVVGEFFRRAGWDVCGDPHTGAGAVADHLAIEWFDVLGVSVGMDCEVEGMASAILALRKASLNPALAVMVGGPIVALTPDFVSRVGADGTAPDAVGAVAQAESLVLLRKPHT
jgi:methanogenic corrinoid protein MtbC1